MRPSNVVAYYSIWKVAVVELSSLSLAILPLLPGGRERTTYFQSLYEFPLSGVLIAACAIMAILFLAYLPIFTRALLRKPSFRVSGDRVYIRSDAVFTNCLKLRQLKARQTGHVS
jgi:hypothetical protein